MKPSPGLEEVPRVDPPVPEEPGILPNALTEQAEEVVARRVHRAEEIVDGRLERLEVRGIIPADDRGERRQRIMRILSQRNQR